MNTFLKLAAVAALLAAATPTAAKIRVVASTTDLGSIAAAVGGDQVEVASIARGNANAHKVEVLPSYMVRVSRARIYLKVGLGLDTWANPIIDGSHNGKLRIVDCSQAIDVLEKPTGQVNASMGDVHPNGNPHYWLDPSNGGIVAQTIAEALSLEDPAHAADFADRAKAFGERCKEVASRGREAGEGLAVKEIVTYHRSWTYLAAALGVKVAAEVEPLPGIPPTGNHLQELVTLIQDHKIPLLLYEPYFSDEAGEFLERQTGIQVIKMSPTCDDVTPESYIGHLESVIQAFVKSRS